LTAYGLTRCGANQNILAVQVLASGTVALTDGTSTNCVCIRVVADELNNLNVYETGETDKKPEGKENVVAFKTLLPVHTIGAVAVAEGIGLVFVSITECFQPKFTAKILYRGTVKDTETGTSVEATVAVSNHLAGIVDGHDVLLINMANGEVMQKLPLPNMQADERPWQLSLTTNTICVCTPLSVMWLHSSSSTWSSSGFNAAVACAVEPTSEKLAILTALGDVVIVDTKSKTTPIRLKVGSAIEPFICMHTRDGIAAWGGLFARTLRLLKAGGNVQEVVLK
jgi:hypothetical protein